MGLTSYPVRPFGIYSNRRRLLQQTASTPTDIQSFNGWKCGNRPAAGLALPDGAALLGRSNHRRAGLAGERLSEFRQVGQRANDTESRHRMDVGFDQVPLGLDPHRVAAELRPREEEL